mmetsp:Transcript_66859/g.164845  ORF Transcript_66859/g.164845 Transcript_66859/m.164845 type:complete len:203 (-) Transcript_66859:3743-4351(-)
MIEYPQLVDQEVGQRPTHGHGHVGLAGRRDDHFGLLSDLLLLRDLVGRDLGALQPLDELDVLEDVALGGREAVQQLVLEGLELHLEAVLLLHQHHLLLLQVGPLLVDDEGEQLLLQPVERDHEVDERRLRRDLGLVVRVAQLRLQVELEVGVILDLLVAQLDDHGSAAADDGAHEDGVEHRVDVLANVLNHDGLPALDRHLD